MSESLKVLMMGGRRCGKTSALTSLFDQMKNGVVKDYFTVSDRTVLETKGLERQDSLDDKAYELQYMLETNGGSSNIFLADKNPTNNFWLYKLHIQIPGTSREMDIEFRDSAGEFFVSSGTHADETKAYIKDCDVFVIVIDTPYLMGPVEETMKDKCNEAINSGTNRVKDIHDFLTHINDNGGKDAKMVVFVPLKCERWVKEGRINEVTRRIKDVYSSCIASLEKYSKMNISILPMETSGNILFSEFQKAYNFEDVSGRWSELYRDGFPGLVRCCKIDDETIRLENGENILIEEGAIIKRDSEAVIDGTNIPRPYSWYEINAKDNSFAPKNCEQLPLHILRFMLNKLYDAKTSAKGGLIDWFKQLIRRILNIFGTMNPDELQSVIRTMQKDGVIKDSGYGIEIIKRF